MPGLLKTGFDGHGKNGRLTVNCQSAVGGNHRRDKVTLSRTIALITAEESRRKSSCRWYSGIAVKSSWSADQPERLRRWILNCEPERRHQVIMGANLEGPIALVGILSDADLVIEKFFLHHLGFKSPRQMKAIALQQNLDPGHEPGLPQSHGAIHHGASVAMREVDRPAPDIDAAQ